MNAVALLHKSTKAAALPLGLAAGRKPGDAVVLLYHKVGSGDREIDIPKDGFASQMQYLARNEHPKTLDDCLARGGVTVTVDDGFRDFSENVLPLVVDYDIPILLYLATGLVVDNGGRRSEGLTWNQLAEATSTGLVEVGAHTHSHANLGRACTAEAEEEMRRCKEQIEDHLGAPCRHFSYPWSRASSAAQQAARRLFSTAALPWRTNRAGAIDPYQVGRTPVLRSDAPLFFRAKLAGRLDGEALVYRALRRGPWRRS